MSELTPYEAPFNFLSTQLKEIPIRIGIMQLAKKKNRKSSTVNTIISEVIGIKTAQNPVKIENPQHNKEEFLLV